MRLKLGLGLLAVVFGVFSGCQRSYESGMLWTAVKMEKKSLEQHLLEYENDVNIIENGNGILITMPSDPFNDVSGFDQVDTIDILMKPVMSMVNTRALKSLIIRVYANSQLLDDIGQRKNQMIAEWIGHYLWQKGVASEQIIAQGMFPDAYDIAPQNTSWGRKDNRRIEIEIEYER